VGPMQYQQLALKKLRLELTLSSKSNLMAKVQMSRACFNGWDWVVFWETIPKFNHLCNWQPYGLLTTVKPLALRGRSDSRNRIDLEKLEKLLQMSLAVAGSTGALDLKSCDKIKLLINSTEKSNHLSDRL
jgi:hypothetical protein